MRLLRLIRANWLVCTALTLAAITVLSLRPVTVPDVPGGDKTMHLAAYAALMFPAGLRRPKRVMMIFLFFLLYSGMIELIQPYVSRSGEWLDLAANTIGLACGMLLAGLLRRLTEDREDSPS